MLFLKLPLRALATLFQRPALLVALFIVALLAPPWNLGQQAYRAVAQNAGQTLTNLLTTDLIQVYRFGTAAITYANPGQIAAETNTTKVTPGNAALGGTGYGNTMANNQGHLLFILTGTMPYSYMTFSPSPSDGARQCAFAGGGTITLFYPTANAGQTVHNAVTTLATGTGVCYTYSLSNTTWDRS